MLLYVVRVSYQVSYTRLSYDNDAPSSMMSLRGADNMSCHPEIRCSHKQLQQLHQLVFCVYFVCEWLHVHVKT